MLLKFRGGSSAVLFGSCERVSVSAVMVSLQLLFGACVWLVNSGFGHDLGVRYGTHFLLMVLLGRGGASFGLGKDG